jgi:uncharacterized protein (DUF983 family)
MSETKHQCPHCGRCMTTYVKAASVYHRCGRKAVGGHTERLTRFVEVAP